MNNQKTINNIHSEYSKAVNKARNQNYQHQVLNSLTEAEKEAIKLLGGLDDMSGGQLNKLVSAYNLIKNSK